MFFVVVAISSEVNVHSTLQPKSVNFMQSHCHQSCTQHHSCCIYCLVLLKKFFSILVLHFHEVGGLTITHLKKRFKSKQRRVKNNDRESYISHNSIMSFTCFLNAHVFQTPCVQFVSQAFCLNRCIIGEVPL